MSNYTEYCIDESLQHLRDYTENIEVLLLVAVALFLLLWYGQKFECEQLLKAVRQRNGDLKRSRAQSAKHHSSTGSALAKADPNTRFPYSRIKHSKIGRGRFRW